MRVRRPESTGKIHFTFTDKGLGRRKDYFQTPKGAAYRREHNWGGGGAGYVESAKKTRCTYIYISVSCLTIWKMS